MSHVVSQVVAETFDQYTSQIEENVWPESFDSLLVPKKLVYVSFLLNPGL
jgi:hypothetical protein